MRIHWYWPYAHRATYPLISAAQRSDDEVTVQSLSTRFGARVEGDAEYEVIRDLRETGGVVPRHRGAAWAFHRSKVYRQRSIARLRMLKTGGFDISCQYHLNPFVDWFYLPKSPSRTAMVAFVHDVRPHEARVPNTLEHVFLKGTYRAADELVVYHVSLKSSLVEEFGLNAKNIHVLRHPLHPPAPGLRPSVVDGPLRVLFFGTFRANKGLEVLIRAAASLRHQSGITFHVAGRGNHDLESLVARASAELPNLTCEIGYVDRQRREQLFRTSHLVVLPYTTMESQSGVLATAYSNALPLVVSDVGALGKTVSEDGTGLVIPPGDPASLCEAISRVAHRPDLIPQFSDAIHAAASMYSHETVGRALRDVFESAAERRQRRLQGLTAQKNRLGRAHRDELLGRTLEHEHAD